MGIGLAVARALAREGWAVVVAARSRSALRRARESLPGSGHGAVHLDVGSNAQWSIAVDQIIAGGELHGLVCAAGILGPIGALDELDPAEVESTIRTNLIGTLLALHHTLPLLRASGGRAVTFSGGGGTAPLARYDAYAASKAGVVRLTENVAASGDIEINSVAPGFVVTRMHTETLAAGPGAAGAAYHRRTQEQVDAGGVSASEAAALVSFLLSSDAAGISGKLLSAQWDPWRDNAFRAKLRQRPDLATLRRIDEVFFDRVTQ